MRFNKHFTKITMPLFKFLTKYCEIYWDSSCQLCFDYLKQCFFEAHILRWPNWSLPPHISTYDLDKILGVIIGKNYQQKPYVIHYIIKNITQMELNYIVIEQAFLVVFHAKN